MNIGINSLLGNETGWSRRVKRWGLPVLGIALALALSEITSRLKILPPEEYPPVSVIGQSLLLEIQSQLFWRSVGQTVEGWAIGLALGIATAIPIGIVIGANEQIFRSLRLVIEALRPVPPVALIPLAILIFGIGMGTKVFLITLSAFWPILFQTIYGVQDVDPIARDTVRSYGLGRLARVRYLVLPSAAPYIMTGIRIASSIALIVAVSTELVVGAPGLGKSINEAQIGGANPVQYSYIVAAGVLGWVLSAFFRRLERQLLHWHESQNLERIA